MPPVYPQCDPRTHFPPFNHSLNSPYFPPYLPTGNFSGYSVPPSPLFSSSYIADPSLGNRVMHYGNAPFSNFGPNGLPTPQTSPSRSPPVTPLPFQVPTTKETITSPNGSSFHHQKSDHLSNLPAFSLPVHHQVDKQKQSEDSLLNSTSIMASTVPSSPIHPQGDWGQLLEEYIAWHVRKAPSQKDRFMKALDSLYNDAYSLEDIQSLQTQIGNVLGFLEE